VQQPLQKSCAEREFGLGHPERMKGCSLLVALLLLLLLTEQVCLQHV
jgi:hypothetical protein